MISPDHDLIQACLRQEQDGWKTLIARYQRLIYSVARSFCPLPEDTADIFQQVCLELHRSLHQLRDEQTLSAWLITVTRHRAYAYLRKQKPQVPIEDFDAAVDARVRLASWCFERPNLMFMFGYRESQRAVRLQVRSWHDRKAGQSTWCESICCGTANRFKAWIWIPWESLNSTIYPPAG